jgi:hypothetical protein
LHLDYPGTAGRQGRGTTTIGVIFVFDADEVIFEEGLARQALIAVLAGIANSRSFDKSGHGLFNVAKEFRQNGGETP